MDKLIGRIVRALDESGARDNTLIVVTADNGTGGDGKSQATEKGARVPLIINGKALVKPRGATRALADLSDIFPTLMDFAGVRVPATHMVDGHSLAPFLRGERDTTREWIFAYQADRRILRTERWLLEDNSPLHYGHLFDCGTGREGNGYVDVTTSNHPEVRAARNYFNRLLEKLPAPRRDHEGPPNENKLSPPDATRGQSNNKKR